MAVTKDDVKKIAELARLEFNENELDDYTKEMNKVLGYVEKLNKLDTTNVRPLSHPIENENVFREDVLVKSVSTEEALKNAPDKTSEHFKVPKVISK
ncbi:MAG: Asp-tRNA(Asn)/Glu-tRNA(Gln) amidotransferase subunit GatC [Melioribacteraceae bacterium]